MLAKFYNADRNFSESHLPIFSVDRNCGESRLPIFSVSRIFDESRDDLSEFLPKGLSAERNDFD